MWGQGAPDRFLDPDRNRSPTHVRAARTLREPPGRYWGGPRTSLDGRFRPRRFGRSRSATAQGAPQASPLGPRDTGPALGFGADRVPARTVDRLRDKSPSGSRRTAGPRRARASDPRGSASPSAALCAVSKARVSGVDFLRLRTVTVRWCRTPSVCHRFNYICGGRVP
jgi:hypothetical protein